MTKIFLLLIVVFSLTACIHKSHIWNAYPNMAHKEDHYIGGGH